MITNHNDIFQLLIKLKEEAECVRVSSEKQVERIVRHFEKGRLHSEEVDLITSKDKIITILAETLQWNLYTMIPLLERAIDSYTLEERTKLVFSLRKIDDCLQYVALKQKRK